MSKTVLAMVLTKDEAGEIDGWVKTNGEKLEIIEAFGGLLSILWEELSKDEPLKNLEELRAWIMAYADVTTRFDQKALRREAKNKLQLIKG